MFREMDVRIPPSEAMAVFNSRRPSGRDLRKVLAKLNTTHGIGLPSWFFGYGDDGQPVFNERTRISLGETSTSSLRITALGSQASNLLLEKSGAIQSALIRSCNTLVQADMRSGEHAILGAGEDGFIHGRHWLHRIVVGKTSPTTRWWKAAKRVTAGGQWLEEDFLALADIISSGIIEQAQTLMSDGDEIHGEMGQYLQQLLIKESGSEGDHDIALQIFKRRLGVKVNSIGGYVGVRAAGPQGLRVMLKDVSFSMSAHLSGPWIVGRNRREGFGQIKLSRPIPSRPERNPQGIEAEMA